MRLASYVTRGRSGYGVVIGTGIVDMRARMGPRFPTLRDVLREGALAELRARAAGVRADHPLAEVRILPPVVAPENVFCVGAPPPAGVGAAPEPHLKPPGSLVGHLTPIVRPRGERPLALFGTLAVVIGREGRRITPGSALDHVAGVTLCHAGTVRDATAPAPCGALSAVGFEASGAIGPWIVTPDGLDLTRPLRLVTRVGGEAVRDVTTRDAASEIAESISDISLFTTLKPGDVIVTGTPAGSTSRDGPPRFAQRGDIVEVAVEEIGVLRNEVVDEP